MVDIEKYNWGELDNQKKKCAQIRRDISTARGIINDALLRYIKKKSGARNKKQAANMTLLFADLEEYNSIRDIEDAYGWDIISEKEMDRLKALWEVRENQLNASGKFEDNVTALVTRAMNGIGEEYIDLLNETDEALEIAQRRKREIEQENIRYEYERRHNQNVADGDTK